MFHPHPTVQAMPLFDGHVCLVVDNALQDPQGWREFSQDERGRFASSGVAYPGLELWVAEEATARCADFVAQHVRARLGGRRTLSASTRMSIVCTPPHELQPRQWQCHRDSSTLADDEMMLAMVVYLFDDEALGGTNFYSPRRTPEATRAMVRASVDLDAQQFRTRHPEVQPGYMCGSNDWFEHRATVPPRFNRAIFYDGGLFHSGDIRAPERMTPDPATGRLTMNAFIRCRRAAR